VGEVELDELVNLTSAAVRGMPQNEGSERVGVDLFSLRRRVRRRCRLLVAEDMKPLRRFVGGIAASAAARQRGERNQNSGQDENAAHWLQK
jgi:hypothetical protein